MLQPLLGDVAASNALLLKKATLLLHLNSLTASPSPGQELLRQGSSWALSVLQASRLPGQREGVDMHSRKSLISGP